MGLWDTRCRHVHSNPPGLKYAARLKRPLLGGAEGARGTRKHRQYFLDPVDSLVLSGYFRG